VPAGRATGRVLLWLLGMLTTVTRHAHDGYSACSRQAWAWHPVTPCVNSTPGSRADCGWIVDEEVAWAAQCVVGIRGRDHGWARLSASAMFRQDSAPATFARTAVRRASVAASLGTTATASVAAGRAVSRCVVATAGHQSCKTSTMGRAAA
jgi:hypothetical protein